MARRNGGFVGQDGLDAPDPPTGVTVSGGTDGIASISFTAPSDTGTSAITGFIATASTGVGATATSSPISVTGLTLGTAATFRAYTVNAYGTSAASDATDSITPAAARGVFGNGFSASGTRSNVLQYITIVSTGNSTDFGDMTITSTARGGMASSTRGVYSGGNTSGGKSNVIDYITIASTGNATDFGDASTAHNPNANGGASSSTRGVFSLGLT